MDGDPLDVESFPSHRLPLDHAPEAYEKFQRKEDGFFKVILSP
jgi:threonine dehydrogenase-like Zn-dependent dehydrogenase